MFGLFSKKANSVLGIDFGTTVVKIVELNRQGGKFKLGTYGLAKMEVGEETQRNIKDLAQVLKSLLAEAKVKSKSAYIAIPESYTFFALIEMPEMPEKDLVKAIPYEARKYIPVPAEQVYLEWIIFPKDAKVHEVSSPENPEGEVKVNLAGGMQVLLVAVMRDVVDNLSQIAVSAGLEVLGFESECFSLMRSTLLGEIRPTILIDVGAHSINVDTIDGGYLRFNYEQEMPLLRMLDNATMQKQAVDSVFAEIKRASNLYQGKTKRNIEKCIVAGGGAFIAGLMENLSQRLGIEVLPANPFSDILYPSALQPAISEVGPSLSVAVGLAKR
jgi:type IV pilus assembly protein PilM